METIHDSNLEQLIPRVQSLKAGHRTDGANPPSGVS